jgi:hypothetical protein
LHLRFFCFGSSKTKEKNVLLTIDLKIRVTNKIISFVLLLSFAKIYFRKKNKLLCFGMTQNIPKYIGVDFVFILIIFIVLYLFL